MGYFFYSGFWGFIIILGFIYLIVKVSRLSDRIRALEDGIRAGTLRSATAPSPQVQVTSSGAMPSPAPLPPPPSMPISTETQEEASARWLGWVGAIMLLLGVSFFLKYAFDHWVQPPGQVAIGILGGIAIIVVGQKLRAKYLKYSDMLFGAGIGILYLAIYAGFAFYDPVVIPQTLAFVLMALITTLAMVIAVMGGTINIAVLGVLGGFLTPVLLSTGTNELVTLSLYMLVLNLGVLGISWFKKWAQLNYLTFFGTIVLFGGWMERFYWRDPDGQLGMTFFFLTLFFLLFLANSIIHHFSRQENSTKSDLVLLVLNAMGYFGVCYDILEPKYDNMLGFFALFLAVLYLGVAYVTYSSNKHDRILNLTLPGIAVVFLSIAIPLQLSGYFITIAWLIEALLLVYVGLEIREKPIQVFGWIVLVLGLVSLFGEVEKLRSGLHNWIPQPDAYTVPIPDLFPVFNMAFFLLVLGVGVLYGLAYLYMRGEEGGGWKRTVTVFVVMANLLTIFAFTSEVDQKYSQDIRQIEARNQKMIEQQNAYNGNTAYDMGYYDRQSAARVKSYAETRALENRSNTITSVLWALYAILLIVIGLIRRIRVLRLFGLIFFFITALKVLAEVWALGQLYRIISTILFGVIALGGAFLYTKHKDKLKEIIYD